MTNSIPPKLRMFLFMLAAVAGITLQGCENTVDPLQENNQFYYSIYGYLDAAADTQWVRVMPVRDSLFLAPRPIDADVTMQHLPSGNHFSLSDSLFRYGEEAYAYNYWTDQVMEPGAQYQLTARRSDGRQSTVQFTFPKDFPDPDVNILPQDDFDLIYVYEVEKIAVVNVIYEVLDPARPDSLPNMRVPVSQLDQVEPISNGFLVSVYPGEDAIEIRKHVSNLYVTFQPVEVFIAAASTDWPDFQNLDDEDLALPNVISNIENGVGYIAPILTKTVPYE